MAAVEFLYLLCLLGLSLYGFNSLVLIYLFTRRGSASLPECAPPDEWPHVTVQLPIYNERHTVQRLLNSVGGLDYPHDRLEIQVLDDSTDETSELVAQALDRLREQGIDALHVTRSDRTGYKAGALAAGLVRAKGTLIAIFDADFCPEPDFLRRVVPRFAAPNIGCIQTRWGHINRDYSLLTRIQALGVDGHFLVEQTARSRAGLFINFNGTAGVWRRTCIDAAGGWSGDTLTEDLDLSYRAQLCGWRILYLPDVVVPAELPAQISALRRQQARWAQGSTQTAMKMIGPLLRSSQPWKVKTEGVVHLTGYAVHPLMLFVVLLTLPMSFSHSWVLAAAPWLMFAGLGPPLLYAVAQGRAGERDLSRLRVLPLLLLLGIGLALSDSWAVLKAILKIPQGFRRTPKFALHHAEDAWVNSAYALSTDSITWGELALALFSLAPLAAPNANRGFVPWLLLYSCSFAFTSCLSLAQSHERRRWLAAQPRSAVRRVEHTPQSARERIRGTQPGRDK